MNPACWKKLLMKVAFPIDLKYEMKSQPVHVNRVCMMDARLLLHRDARSGSFFSADCSLFRCIYRIVELSGVHSIGQ